MAKCMGCTAKIAKNRLSLILTAAMEKQSTHSLCIIYTEEHNGTVPLTYKARTKQLASPPSKFEPNNCSTKG